MLPVLVLLGLWEISYFLGLVDPIRFSHPKAVIHVLLNNTFLEGFLLMGAQLACAFLVGGTIGVVIGSFVMRSGPFAQGATRFLRLGLWFPFLMSWAIPISYSADPTRIVLTIWTWTVSVVAVALFTCYSYLNARFVLGLEWVEARHDVIRRTILQALFISIISQVWLGPYGWSFFWPGVEYIERIYAAAILLFAVVVLTNEGCRYSFEQGARIAGEIVRRTLISGGGRRSLIDAWLIVLAIVMLWQALSLSGLDSFTSSPLAILKGGYYFLVAYSYGQPVFSNNITISLVEVLGGVAIAGAAALMVSKAYASSLTLKAYVLSVVPVTFILPILIPLFLNGWLGPAHFWWTLLGIAAICFSPCMEIFSGLKDTSLIFRLLIAADHALPFAFVAMIFGEAMNASAGLGFSMLVGRASRFLPTGLGAALTAVGLFLIISSSLRFAARKVYFANIASDGLKRTGVC